MALTIEPSRTAPPGSVTGGRVRLRTLIIIRWVAIAGQVTALLVVQFGLGYPVPLPAALAAVAVSVIVNVWATIGRRSPERLGDRAAAFYLAYDLLQLGVLLYLTGGLHNPFAVLILAPVIVSATVLSRISTIALSALALVVVVVLALDGSLDAAARLYYAGAVGIALGTRHILDRLGEHGYAVAYLHLTGGHAQNPLLLELYANATGCSVVLGAEEDGVLLGTAMVAAVAAGRHPSLADAAVAMGRTGRVIAPAAETRSHFDARYRAYLLMQEHSRTLEEIMASRRPARSKKNIGR